jgi:hypothetical protein
MTTKELKNIQSSILQRLKNYSDEKQEDYGLTLSRFAIERFLYRLSLSEYSQQFVLKGAQLFQIWTNTPYRSTRDLDLLKYGSEDISELVRIFQSICNTQTDSQDGIEFLAETVRGETIRNHDEYKGVRMKLEYRIGKTGQLMQIDIGFGDIITPRAKGILFPTILDMPKPTVLSYSRESVIAEKVEAMVRFGIANSRMKDFFDIHKLSEDFDFDGKNLKRAIKSTFTRRGTKVPDEVPLAFTREFTNDELKQAQWKGFLRKNALENKLSESNFEKVIDGIKNFIFPIIQAVKNDNKFESKWEPSKGWICR